MTLPFVSGFTAPKTVLSAVTTIAAAIVFFAALSFVSVNSPHGVAYAQSLQGMSCYDLWYERNAIFARNGYCFKTDQARSVFGPACFPPYGRLSSYEQNRVDAIQRQERVMGCRPGGSAGVQPPPQSSPYAGMSCDALWYARNEIYARNGHCFKSARGRAAFGSSCFPPYGQLGSVDQREVDTIIGWERRRGCR